MKNPADHLPAQIKGKETNFTADVKFPGVEEAHDAYKTSAARLLNVNDWHNYTGFGSSKFSLCNNLGDELTGFAAQGQLIRIDLPGPGSDAGEGSEWVMIEDMRADGDENTAEEFLLFTVRPIPNPKAADDQIAHFYTDESTSTFIVRRDGRVISAGAHGRNEEPNNENVDLHDKIRNTAIALLARNGISGGQWQKLVNGIVEQ